MLIAEIRLDERDRRKVLPHDVVSKVPECEADHDKKQRDSQDAVALHIEIEESERTNIHSAPGQFSLNLSLWKQIHRNERGKQRLSTTLNVSIIEIVHEELLVSTTFASICMTRWTNKF